MINASFQFFEQALNARAYRQQVLASNIANADTPNYRARDVDFSKVLGDTQAGLGGALPMTTSSSLHLAAAPGSALETGVYYRTALQGSLDKNTVNMDIERAQFTDNAIHYEAALAFLNNEIKTMQSAITG